MRLETLFFSLRLCLFIFSEREKEGERNINVWLTLTHPWGPGPQTRHVPWLGIKPVTLWFTGRHSVHWATPARAGGRHFKSECWSLIFISQGRKQALAFLFIVNLICTWIQTIKLYPGKSEDMAFPVVLLICSHFNPWCVYFLVCLFFSVPKNYGSEKCSDGSNTNHLKPPARRSAIISSSPCESP